MTARSLTVLGFCTVLSSFLLACGDKDEDDGGSGGTDPTDDTGTTGDDTGTTGDDTGSGTDDTAEPDPVNGTISGTVTVKLFQWDDDGELEFLSWEEAFGKKAGFPFGMIYVAAYSDGDDGREEYHGEALIAAPTTDGDDYTMDVQLDVAGDVRVYASLDIWADTIIHSWDPIGVHPDTVVVEEGTAAEDVDITILVDYDEWACGSCNGRYGPGRGGGGGTCDTVNLNGPVTLNFGYVSGNGLAMLLDSNGGGPYYWDWFTPTAAGSGGEGSYGMDLCENTGTYDLKGAIDTNGNGLVDPSDTWGTYVVKPETDGNPITVATANLDDYEIEIPIETSGVSIVPFVQLSGTLTMDSGNGFDADLPSGTTVYVAALQYRPTSDLAVASLLANAYDVEVFEWTDLTGETSKDWELGVPANTIVYLWAYADHDGDEVVNESGDWVASGGDSNGRLETGESSSDHSLALAVASD